MITSELNFELEFRILILEDLPTDVVLAEHEIKHVLKNYVLKVVDNEPDFRQALDHFKPDLIISDYKLPTFDGLKALRIVLEKYPIIPVIISTGSMNEDTAVECMKAGAVDYVIKEHIKRLGPAIINALEQKQLKKQKHEAERQLIESEERYRLLLQHSGIGVGLYGPDGEILLFNPTALKHLGGKAEDFIGKNLRDVFGKSFADEYIRRIKQTIDSDIPLEFEDYVELKTGKYWFLTNHSKILNSGGGVIGVQVLAYDITHRKITEEKLLNSLQEIEKLKDQIQSENSYLQEEIKLEHNFSEIVGNSELMKKMLSQVELVSQTESSVLILGETGTGKELIARAVHALSSRNNRSLVKVNCAVLPANLIESELFGHEKGSFTGAIRQHIGRFEIAHNGTIFLDEIGELPTDLQVKLLRVLQEGEIERLGGSKTIPVDVRIIAATNRNLELLIEEGKFRQDLFYRLNVFPITCPPLRERKDDIPLLVNHFVKIFNKKMGKNITNIPMKTIVLLESYDWPGNVRELENVIERAMIINSGNQLFIDENYLSRNSMNMRNEFLPLEEYEKNYIISVLEKTNWKIRGANGAAVILGMNPTTLESRIQKLGIKKSDIK